MTKHVKRATAARAKAPAKSKASTPAGESPAPATPAAKASTPPRQGGRQLAYTPEAAALVVDSIRASYSPALADLMLLKISTIPRTIPEICELHPELPAVATVYNWLAVQDEFAERFVTAMRIRALLFAEDWLREVRNLTNDPRAYTTTKVDGKDVKEPDTTYIGLKRMSLDRIQWYVTKLLPRLLGDRQQKDEPGEAGRVEEYQVPARRPIEGPAAAVDAEIQAPGKTPKPTKPTTKTATKKVKKAKKA